ncbi:permease [Salinisphaera sp. LB1]|uniref:permease n=1 Tax=Salinisphaera sp. LB1 TaxID=2183911 RepID=UPI000D707D10|nr:permease [Salinisphaera sp. LB1]AWN14465.1 putative INTEGRAL MEMBRANE PROTEIN [Salinisphaera sp. LB1]
MDIILLLDDTLYTIAGMFWKILWALILGFAISGAVQAFVPKRRMVQVMGDDSAASLSRARFFAAISSSCSYAATAMSRSAFMYGAHITASINAHGHHVRYRVKIGTKARHAIETSWVERGSNVSLTTDCSRGSTG